jgi:AraC-like DNA-binding protein
MHPAVRAKDFVVAPAGSYLARRTFLLCAPSAQRLVVFHVASLAQGEEATVSDLLGLPDTPGLAPTYDLVYDVGAVATMDLPSFKLFETFVNLTIDFVAKRTRRFALIRPGGLPGHMFSGMFHDWLVPRLGKRVRMFDARSAAYAWLRFPPVERTAVDRAIDAFTRTTPLLRQMREVLASDLRAPSIARVAAKLGVSARSLQRHLGEVGTTFRDELADLRIRAAQALLVDTEDKIEWIASELGFKSRSAFAASFRAALGDTPIAFRERRRKTAPSRDTRVTGKPTHR